MEFTKKIGNKRIGLRCHESLRRQAEWLLELFREIVIDKGEEVLSDGYRIQVGWTIFTVVQKHHGRFVLCEPDYSKDPFRDIYDDVTCSLSVQAEQNDFVLKVGVAPLATSFQDKIVYSAAITDEKRIYLERKPAHPNDSGWYIGVDESHASTNDLRACFAYELLRIKPEIVKVLQLPEGYLVIFNDNELEAVVNPENDTVLCR